MIHSNETRKITSLREKISVWFEKKGRSFPWRDMESSIYEKIITEILLQRTKSETVASVYSSFFGQFGDWYQLNDAPIEKIQETIKPLGIWRRRSITLKELAREMVRRNAVFPENRNELDKLPGVGQYVGNAIEMFYHDRPMPLLDTNMARVIERVFKPRQLADIRYDPWLQNISREIISTKNAIHLNWAILDIGGTLCKPRNPVCDECPIQQHCNYAIREIITTEE